MSVAHFLTYCPFWIIIIGLICYFIVSLFLERIIQQIEISYINVLIFLMAFLFILNQTVFGRTEKSVGIRLIPFFWGELIIRQEDIRSMVMNVLLFIPLTTYLPYIIKITSKKYRLLTVIIGSGISLCVEFVQFYFGIGLAETNDVICNTLGSLIGLIIYEIQQFMLNKYRTIKE